MKGLSCAITGHRELRPDLDKNKVYDALEELILEGYTTFYDGMAQGFDLLALECLVDLKQRYHVRIEACIPYMGQEKYMGKADAELYRRLLTWCDETHILGEKFLRGCYLSRDRYMVDRCDLLLAYMYKDVGGTAYTVKYAKDRGIEVRFVV